VRKEKETLYCRHSISCTPRRSVTTNIMGHRASCIRSRLWMLSRSSPSQPRETRVPPPTSGTSARSSPQDFVFTGWPNLSGIDLQTNGSIPSAQEWQATTAGPGSMPKSRNTVLIFSTITSTGSSRKPSNHSELRFSICRAPPLMLYQRPIIELVKTPGRRRNPQTKAKSVVPSSSKLRSVLTASIEVRVLDITLVETHVAVRNRKRKTIRLSRRMPLHKPSSMPETRKTLSRVRYRLVHN